MLTSTFPIAADALVSGRFYSGDQRHYPATVTVTSLEENLLWIAKDSQGANVPFRYGSPGDTITNLGDWNCDGVDDIHVVRPTPDGLLTWFVAISNGTIEEYKFGLHGDRAGVAKAANGCIQALVLLRMEGNQFRWFFKGLENINDPFQFQTTLWGLTGDIPLIPVDIDGDNLLDFVVTRPVGGFQEGYIRYGNGTFEALLLGFDDSIPQIGFYDGTPLFAWSQRDNGGAAIRHSNGFLNIFNFGDAESAIIRADGSVIQPTTTGRFGQGEMTPVGGTPGTGNGACANSGGGTGSGNPPCSSLAFNDGRGGDLWIEHSESDGRPVYLLNSGWRSAPVVDIERTDGTCERARFTGFANPDPGGLRPHYRFDRGCESYTGTLFVKDAVQTCEVVLPRNPCERID